MSLGSSRPLISTLLEEVLRDGHRYAPGIGHRRPVAVAGDRPVWRTWAALTADRCRDGVERIAARGGFSHRHFDPRAAASALERILTLGAGYQATYDLLADERSRRTLLELLELRVLGPHHAPLSITPQEFRSRQAAVDNELLERAHTFEVSDPWFSPISLYRVPMPVGEPARLHCHSVDVVSVFVLQQYSYRHSSASVTAEPGDVVIDAGGCWGDTALYLASLVGDRGRVYTFEFDPESLAIMRANLDLNPKLANRIEVVERALWNVSDELIGFAQSGRCTTVDGDSSELSGQVSTITLDDFVDRAGIDRLGFIKADVEGAESRLLEGARGSLERFRPRLALAAYHAEEDLVTLPQQLGSSDYGYRLYLQSFSPVEDETVLFAAPS